MAYVGCVYPDKRRVSDGWQGCGAWGASKIRSCWWLQDALHDRQRQMIEVCISMSREVRIGVVV
jgi:hypothetical protein